MSRFESHIPAEEEDGKMEEEKVGMFDDVGGRLAESWKQLDIETQQRIADALARVTGRSPAEVAFIPDEHAPRFNEFVRTYLSETTTADAKEAAADAIRRAMEKGLDN